MKKKIFGLLLIGIVIILIVVLISTNSSDNSKKQKKKTDENVYTCEKMDINNQKERKRIKHIVKLKDVDNEKDIDTYLTINEYKFNSKNEYEKKCYETKTKERYINSSKDIDFVEKVTCNDKKKLVTVKDTFVISKLSKAGKKSLEKVLKYQKENKFNIKDWLKSQKEDKYSCN